MLAFWTAQIAGVWSYSCIWMLGDYIAVAHFSTPQIGVSKTAKPLQP